MTNGNSAERERFEYARSLLPNEMYWGEPITVAAVLHIADAALSVCADGGKGEEDKPTCPHCGLTDIEYSRTCHNSACSAYAREESFYRGWQDAAPQAECAPREAQPVGPRTTLNYDGTFDTTCAHCGGNGCFACLKSAAPTPERADADTAGASDPVEQFLSEVHAELLRARAKFPGDRIMTIALAEEFGELCKAVLDEPAANVRKEAIQTAVMCARVVLDGDGSVNEWRAQKGLDPLVKSSFAAGASQERADAGKDAALSLLSEIYFDLIQGAMPDKGDPWYEKARAILAAKEKK
jgi:hypothetical protein